VRGVAKNGFFLLDFNQWGQGNWINISGVSSRSDTKLIRRNRSLVLWWGIERGSP
jgi:hypothetical protein